MEKKKIKLKTRFLISIVIGILAFIIGFCISWTERSGDTPEKIKETEQAIEKLCMYIGKEGGDVKDGEANVPAWRRDVILAFSWKDLEKITDSLTYQNEKIAKAKALIRCEANPIPKYSFDDYLWNDRYEVSNHEWKIQTIGSRIITGIWIAVLSCIVTAVGIFLILTIMSWLWYFLLERISELSQAIRRK
jgi:hypothetical protein